MGYAVYMDRDARDSGVTRWAGYGVSGICDHPECTREINRGLGFKCEIRYIEGGDDGDELEVEGCGLYFCMDHLPAGCPDEHDAFTPKPDTAAWEQWLLTEESWEDWRQENPEIVAEMRQRHSLENA